MIENGVVEKVKETPLEVADPGRYLNYIPHLCVNRDDKTSSKVRPVYDASCRNNQGISLNDNIYAGPKTQKSISHLNIHMRLNPVVLVSDLEKMFYSVSYQETPPPHTKLDNIKDAFRFLWGDDKDEIPTVYRFCKMLMGCRDSPFQSNSVIEHHLDELIATSDDEKVIEACLLLKRKMYIDDIILALRSVQETIEMR